MRLGPESVPPAGQLSALSAAGLTVVAAAALPVLDLYQGVSNYQPQLLAQWHGSAQIGQGAVLRVFALAHGGAIIPVISVPFASSINLILYQFSVLVPYIPS